MGNPNPDPDPVLPGKPPKPYLANMGKRFVTCFAAGHTVRADHQSSPPAPHRATLPLSSHLPPPFTPPPTPRAHERRLGSLPCLALTLTLTSCAPPRTYPPRCRARRTTAYQARSGALRSPRASLISSYTRHWPPLTAATWPNPTLTPTLPLTPTPILILTLTQPQS